LPSRNPARTSIIEAEFGRDVKQRGVSDFDGFGGSTTKVVLELSALFLVFA